MTDAEDIAKGLTDGGKATLLQGAGCNNHDELLEAGLWEPEFPPEKYPDLKQEYFLVTPLGDAVRAVLQEKG